MELLRYLVKEQGIVSIIEDYKTEMELYEHKQKFKHSLKEIYNIKYYSNSRGDFSHRIFKNKEIFVNYDNYYFQEMNIIKQTNKLVTKFKESNFNFTSNEIPRYKYSKNIIKITTTPRQIIQLDLS